MQFGLMAQYKDYVEKRQGRKLVLFGAGENAAPLIARYYRYDDIFAIWDNNPSKQGKKICGISVTPSLKCTHRNRMNSCASLRSAMNWRSAQSLRN